MELYSDSVVLELSSDYTDTYQIALPISYFPDFITQLIGFKGQNTGTKNWEHLWSPVDFPLSPPMSSITKPCKYQIYTPIAAATATSEEGTGPQGKSLMTFLWETIGK